MSHLSRSSLGDTRQCVKEIHSLSTLEINKKKRWWWCPIVFVGRVNSTLILFLLLLASDIVLNHFQLFPPLLVIYPFLSFLPHLVALFPHPA